MRIVASAEAIARIRDEGGLLFVRDQPRSRGPRLVLTLLEASLCPPADAFEYARFDQGRFLLFIHPYLRSVPEELWIEIHRRGATVRLAQAAIAEVRKDVLQRQSRATGGFPARGFVLRDLAFHHSPDGGHVRRIATAGRSGAQLANCTPKQCGSEPVASAEVYTP